MGVWNVQYSLLRTGELCALLNVNQSASSTLLIHSSVYTPPISLVSSSPTPHLTHTPLISSPTPHLTHHSPTPHLTHVLTHTSPHSHTTHVLTHTSPHSPLTHTSPHSPLMSSPTPHLTHTPPSHFTSSHIPTERIKDLCQRLEEEETASKNVKHLPPVF